MSDRHSETDEREPGHRDPLQGFGGAAPARSALTLRLILAIFGLVSSAACAVVFALFGLPIVFTIALVALAVVAAVDIVVIIRRKKQEKAGSWKLR